MLVSIGEVPREALAIAVAAVVVFSLIFLRGGMLLIGAAEDLELVLATDELDQHHLESALRRLRGYFVLESVLAAAALATVYTGAILRWPGW